MGPRIWADRRKQDCSGWRAELEETKDLKGIGFQWEGGKRKVLQADDGRVCAKARALGHLGRCGS